MRMSFEAFKITLVPILIFLQKSSRPEPTTLLLKAVMIQILVTLSLMRFLAASLSMTVHSSQYLLISSCLTSDFSSAMTSPTRVSTLEFMVSSIPEHH